MSLSVPVRVQGHDPDGTPWQEMTLSQNASFGGVCLHLKHPHHVGQVLLLSLPLPKNFRRYALAEPSYRAYAVVRSSLRQPGAARVGVLLLGKNPPKGYAESPGGRYGLASDLALELSERRGQPRLETYLNLRLRRIESSGGRVQEEPTVTENISRGGARVLTALPATTGELLSVEDLDGRAKTRAEIRNVYVGRDGISRLNLRFLDPQALEALFTAAGLTGL